MNIKHLTSTSYKLSINTMSEVKAVEIDVNKCIWCLTYYKVYEDLCSMCYLGKQNGFCKMNWQNIGPYVMDLRQKELDAKFAKLDDEVIKMGVCLDEAEYKDIYDTIKMLCVELGCNMRPRLVHNLLIGMMPHQKYFTWHQATQLFKLFTFKTSGKYNISDKEQYELVLCCRVKNNWRITELMSTGLCYYNHNFGSAPSTADNKMHKQYKDVISPCQSKLVD